MTEAPDISPLACPRPHAGRQARLLHVGLLAWRRLEETKRTLKSFFIHNSIGQGLKFWYALDGGYNPRVRAVLDRFGEPAFIAKEQQGIGPMFAHLAAALAAKAKPGDGVLLLENDWISLRPLPMDLIWWAVDNPDIAFLRLMGRRRGLRRGRLWNVVNDNKRQASGAPGGSLTKWAKRDVCGETILVGDSYWSHPPSAGRPEFFVSVTDGCDQERKSMGIRLQRPIAWLAQNQVFAHTAHANSTKVHFGGNTRAPKRLVSLAELKARAAEDGPHCALAAESLPVIAECKSVLYIGANPRRFQLYKALSHCDIVVVEAWPLNARQLQAGGRFPAVRKVIEGDISSPRTMSAVWARGPYDMVVWWHGPEHASPGQAARLLAAPDGLLVRLARRVVLVGAPWGHYRQGVVGGNVFERHLSEWGADELRGLGYASAHLGERDHAGKLVGWMHTGSRAPRGARWFHISNRPFRAGKGPDGECPRPRRCPTARQRNPCSYRELKRRMARRG